MPSMSMRYPPPECQEDFESLCLRLFRWHWSSNDLQKYGRRGHAQAGCDLRGTDQHGRMCAVQCKHREAHRKLTNREIAEEVNKAKKARPRIERLVIATSAKRNPSVQSYVLERSRLLQSQKLFSLEVCSWDDLNDLLNEYPDVANSIWPVNSPPTAVATPVEAVAVASHANQAHGEPLDVHAEIDDAASYLRSDNPQVAILLLNRAVKRFGGRFTPRCVYRLHANLGHAYLQLNEPSKASSEFLVAADAQPEDADARLLRARALLMRGDVAGCHEAAGNLVKDHPEHTKAKVAWIESLPPRTSVETAVAAIPDHQRVNGEIAAALARLALESQRHEDAETFARAAVKSEPKWLYAQTLLGEILLRRAEALGSLAKPAAESPSPENLASEAVRLFEPAIAHCRTSTLPGQLPALLCNLAAAYWILGKRSESDRCITQASAEPATDPNVTLSLARFFQLSGKSDRAVAEIQEAPGPRPLELELALAQLLAERNATGDRSDARRSLIARLPEVLQRTSFLVGEWLETLVRLDIDATQLQDAAEHVRCLRHVDHDEARALFFDACVANAQGEREQACAALHKAAAGITGKTHRSTVRQIALQCEGMALFDQAIATWRILALINLPDEAAEHLVSCAYRAGRWDIVTGFCGSLREAGVYDAQFLRAEIGAWERTSPNLDFCRFSGR